MSQRVKNLLQNKTEINQTNDINSLITQNENTENTINTSTNINNDNLISCTLIFNESVAQIFELNYFSIISNVGESMG